MPEERHENDPESRLLRHREASEAKEVASFIDFQISKLDSHGFPTFEGSIPVDTQEENTRLDLVRRLKRSISRSSRLPPSSTKDQVDNLHPLSVLTVSTLDTAERGRIEIVRVVGWAIRALH